MTFLAKIKTWLLIAAGFVLAVASALVAGLIKGRSIGKASARTRKNEDTLHAQEIRHDVEVQASKLPDAPIQQVGKADPDTAAGKLADEWMRDRDAKG